MSDSKIEWTEKTWNPVTGCTPISEGCANCYAKRMAQRLRGRFGYPEDEPFRVTLHRDRLEQPLKLRKPSRIFVCSMGDLFHDDVPNDYIDQVFAVMALAPQHTHILLTKRPERMQEYFGNREDWAERAVRVMRAAQRINYQLYEQQMANEFNWDPAEWEHLWLGVTAENQQRADERIPILLQTPAAVRFVSVEPILGALDLSEWFGLYRVSDGKWAPKVGSRWKDSPDWIIVGGETGPGARPMHPDWVRSLRDQCQAAGVPFLFKQWGEWRPLESADSCPLDKVGYWYQGWRPFSPLYSVGGHSFTIGISPWEAHMARVGRRTAGRILDGRIWDEYPGVMA